MLTWPNESTTPSRARIRLAVTSSSRACVGVIGPLSASAAHAALQHNILDNAVATFDAVADHQWYDQTAEDGTRHPRPHRAAEGRHGEAADLRVRVRRRAGHHQSVSAHGAQPRL